MARTTIGISCGDPNGIGLEVALRAFSDKRLFNFFQPVIFASPQLVHQHQQANDLGEVRIVEIALEHLPAGQRMVRRDDVAEPSDKSASSAFAKTNRRRSQEEHDGEIGLGSEEDDLSDLLDDDADAQAGSGANAASSSETQADDDREHKDEGHTSTDSDSPYRLVNSLRNNVVHVVNCWPDEVTVAFGRVDEASGGVARLSLEHAARALGEGRVDALVTAPIHKSAMQQAGFGFPGHTEFLESAFAVEAERSLMLMVGEEGLRVAVATNHVALRAVATSISPTILRNKIDLLARSLERDFGIVGPRIAVLGLNPHAGDDGAIGSEEQTTIRPAVVAAKERSIDVMGPYPADGFFGSGQYRNFDAVLAMYHDQGLVPFKTLAFGGGVNFTAGLRVVRTSPDHGTALEIAGKGKASSASFAEALFLARDVALARVEYDEEHANPLQPRPKRRDNDRPRRDGTRDFGRTKGPKDRRGKPKTEVRDKDGRTQRDRDYDRLRERDRGLAGDAKRLDEMNKASVPESANEKTPAEGLASGTGVPTRPLKQPDSSKAANLSEEE